MKVGIKNLINPLLIILILYFFQFLIWLLFFDRFKKDVYLLGSVPTYFTASSFIKYQLFFIVFVFSILVGILYANSFFRINDNSNIKFSPIAKFLANFFFFIVLISEVFIIYQAINTEIHEVFIKGFVIFVYASIQKEDSYLRTLLNFGLFPTLYFYAKFGFKSKRLMLLLLVYLINAIFLAQRHLFVVIIMGLLLVFLKRNGYIYKKIKLKNIILGLILLYSFWIFTEIFRYGIFNSYIKGIPLFSYENLIDVLKYNIAAYLSKDFNNAMIAFDSTPSFALSSTGSKLLLKISEFLLGPSEYIPVIDPGPYGTVNLLALIWIDWGYAGIFIISTIGFISGYFYVLFIRTNSFINMFFFCLLFTSLISSIRVNYFFSNFFVYNLLTFILNLIFQYNYKNSAQNRNNFC